MSVEIIKYGDPFKGADNGLDNTILTTAIATASQAKLLCPVKDGRLRNSIMWKVQKSKGAFNNGPGEKAESEIDVSPLQFEGYVGSAVGYSVYQEFGTRHVPAQPYLRPSIFVVYSKGMKVAVTAANVEAMRKAMGAKRTVEKMRSDEKARGTV